MGGEKLSERTVIIFCGSCSCIFIHDDEIILI